MRLTVDTGPQAGTQVPLDRQRPLTLGSEAGCDLQLDDPGVAGQHAVVKALRDSGFGVKALAPGLRLNGSEIEAAPLQDGDVLEVGTTRLTYGSGAESDGPRIPGFRILGQLGRGGNGVVYRAEQVSLHREVALKVLDKKFTDDPQFVAKFVAEARAAAKLGHPNVVHVFDVDQASSTYFYTMEVMHHGSLEAWLKKNGKMPVEQALQVIADAANGLAYAESLGIVHRDIKPDNLMLDQHGTAKIADLGLAFTGEGDEDKVAGTPHFMAPEQVLRKGVDHRTDLYALGCTFYRLVTGKTPFRGQTVKDILKGHVRETAEPAHKVEPTVPADVSAIIQRLMEKEPGARYQSANELLEDVTELLQPPARKGRWIALAAVAVLVAGGAIWWAVNKPKDVVEIEKYRDNPEAARLARVNEELEAQARQDQATIALLRARLDGGTGLELAAALDAVAAAHPGSAAAAEAERRAAAARDQVESARAEAAHARALAQGRIDEVRATVDAAIAAGDLPRALAATTGLEPPEAADTAVFAAGVQALRQGVQQAAGQRAAALRDRLDAALGAQDLAAVRDAAAQLQAIAADEGGWPDDLIPDRAALQQRARDATRTADELVASRTQQRWQTYADALHGEGGVLEQLPRAAFAAAAQRLERVATDLPDSPMAERAHRLGAALRQAARFADALDARIQSGEVQIPLGAETTGTVAGWQRDAGVLALQVSDGSRKPPRAVEQPLRDLTLAQWESLAQQTQEGPIGPGSRACFLAFLHLSNQLQAARGYLRGLRADADESGTGEAGFPLSPNALERLAQELPRDADWAPAIRDELAAGQLLAAGLRALSERRNLAAASHIDRALAEHPHSLTVTGLR
ncbi:MAG: protein kinase [Planctomycetota bacterium]